LADLEQMDYDPKECELCLRKTKPGETLVEVCCGANVQIARSEKRQPSVRRRAAIEDSVDGMEV
jgi:hypothetical protein